MSIHIYDLYSYIVNILHYISVGDLTQIKSMLMCIHVYTFLAGVARFLQKRDHLGSTNLTPSHIHAHKINQDYHGAEN